MKAVDTLVRGFVMTRGRGLRWLREELAALRVTIPLSEGCLSEFVRDADEYVRRSPEEQERSYVERLQKQLALRAGFIQRWTGSDEHLAAGGSAENLHNLVKIARQFALPRRWKLTEPVAVAYRRKSPSYQHWTDDLESDALPQS